MAYEIQRASQPQRVLGTDAGSANQQSYRGLLWLGIALVLIPYAFWAARLVVLSKMGVYK